ncbi:hypothetical protein, partial [Heyndrickxia coagulans]|uniref:hypothetical protein n=1 Tax=Heyndrickxia coagulans TaxID=1398 RepID=UPI001F3ED8C9
LVVFSRQLNYTKRWGAFSFMKHLSRNIFSCSLVYAVIGVDYIFTLRKLSNYLKKAENKKEQLSDEIRREESKRSMYQDSLSSIAAQISNVSSLIETAQNKK